MGDLKTSGAASCKRRSLSAPLCVLEYALHRLLLAYDRQMVSLSSSSQPILGDLLCSMYVGNYGSKTTRGRTG